jgi:hypothetical protein
MRLNHHKGVLSATFGEQSSHARHRKSKEWIRATCQTSNNKHSNDDDACNATTKPNNNSVNSNKWTKN